MYPDSPWKDCPDCTRMHRDRFDPDCTLCGGEGLVWWSEIPTPMVEQYDTIKEWRGWA